MRDKYLDILKKTYANITPKEEKIFAEIINDEGLGKCRPKFNIWGFLFGWYYLLYRHAYFEAVGVLIASLMVGYFFLPGLVIVNSLIGGFCYYYLYLNKFASDIDKCGGINFPDIECLKKKAKTSFVPVIAAVIFILLLIWPVLFAIITGNTLHKVH